MLILRIFKIIGISSIGFLFEHIIITIFISSSTRIERLLYYPTLFANIFYLGLQFKNIPYKALIGNNFIKEITLKKLKEFFLTQDTSIILLCNIIFL